MEMSCNLVRSSQRHGFGQDAIPNLSTKHSFGRDVDLHVQLRLKIHQKTAKVHQAPIAIQIDQQVQVAKIASIASRDRSEHADVARTVTRGSIQDLFASFMSQALERHTNLILSSSGQHCRAAGGFCDFGRELLAV
jgi:hypothetical protein